MSASKTEIPHFHGINFAAASITDPQKQKDFYIRIKEGQQGYYSEMALRNAIVNFGETIPKWKQRMLEEYYTPDIEAAFTKSGDDFYPFQQQYVNKYKAGKEKLDQGIQEEISSHPVLRDLSFLSPESKNALKKKSEAKYQEGRKDPFVAMSKLPRHAIEFASKSINDVYSKTGDKVHFLGFVITSLHSPESYKEQPHYDVLSNKRADRIKVNGHYKFQTEVDFLEAHPTYVFPVIVPDGNAKWSQAIQTEYGLSKADFDDLKAKLASRRVESGREEAVKQWYSAHIIENLEEKRADINLKYIKADGTAAAFTGDVMVMQRDIIASTDSTKKGVDREYQPEPKKVSHYKKEARQNAKEADLALRASLVKMPGLVEALTNLRKREKDGLEPYETISLDREIATENPNLSREQRDELLAAALDEKESERRGYFTSKVLGERKIKSEKVHIKEERTVTI